MENTTVPPKPGAFSEISKRLRVNVQTYALVIALILIWGLFFILTNGIYLSPAKFFEPVPPDDSHGSVICGHGSRHRDRKH